jgi:hypothetical protein
MRRTGILMVIASYGPGQVVHPVRAMTPIEVWSGQLLSLQITWTVAHRSEEIAVDIHQLSQSDTRKTIFPMTFPVDDDGRLLPAILCVDVHAEDYEIGFSTHPNSWCGSLAEIELPPELDSRTAAFMLTPRPSAHSVG